jgi:hypothetical protein
MVQAALADLCGDTVDLRSRVDVIKHKRGEWRATVLAALVLDAAPAGVFVVSAPAPLEELPSSAALVCKATVIVS